MAIYHFSAKVISRAAGSSALAAAAYRSASRLHDERLDRHHDFSNKAGVVHSEVMLPDGAPEEWNDRERLWNDVEAAEIRKDAQLAREVEFAIPRELDQSEGIRLARDFVDREFVARGMVADLNVHWDRGADGSPKPHAHVMLTMRAVDEGGFGAKVRDWNRTELLNHWREAWADHANERLAALDIDARIDHRSLEAQGIDLEPQHKIGPAAARMAAQGLERERVEDHARIAKANGDRLLANPSLALDAITHGQATFTTRDLARFVHRHSEGKEQFDAVMGAVKATPELVALGRDGRGEERFTSHAMIETEQRLERAADVMAGRDGHGLPAAELGAHTAAAGRRGLLLGGEQQVALEHVMQGADLALVVGYAGTGKSAMLGVAREAWEAHGLQVRGLALSGIAAENLEGGSGIASRTIASLEHQWAQGREQLGPNDVLVIDEAGMIGSRQMERIVSEAEKHGAKLVLVGDVEQLQAIEAGAAFRALAERHGAVEISEVRRQREQWQRDATRQLATGRTGEAIRAYGEAGFVHAAGTREGARGALIERWDRERQDAPGDSRIILTHTREEVRALNEAARERMRSAGELGEEVAIEVERGERRFAAGDRVMFLRNERSLEVKNGTLGIVEQVNGQSMTVRTDAGRSVAFDVKHYADIDHGYAATVHKAQGVTVDRAHVLATPGLDRHAAYVALSRHRDSVQLHYGRDDFADDRQLVRNLSRERAKDMASDYTHAFAERRQIIRRGNELGREAEPDRVPAPKRGLFDGLRLETRPAPAPTARSPFDGLDLSSAAAREEGRSPLSFAVERYARAARDIVETQRRGRDALPHQSVALDKAADALNTLRSEASHDLRSAFARDPALLGEAARGRTGNAIRAIEHEAAVRTTPALRADRFVENWNKLSSREQAFSHAWDERGAHRMRSAMSDMAKSLERDPQLESLLRQRAHELGIRMSKGASVSHDLQQWLSRSRDIGLSM